MDKQDEMRELQGVGARDKQERDDFAELKKISKELERLDNADKAKAKSGKKQSWFNLPLIFSYAYFLFLALFLFSSIFIGRSMKKCRAWEIERQHVQGKTILITGANSGIGLYTAEYLAMRGAHIIMGCRSQERCDEAKAGIVKKYGASKIDTVKLDLASFVSIKKAADTVKSKISRLDVLVNNAAVMALPEREVVTETGLEMQMGTNHFGHFLLTALLWPIVNKQGGRIVNHASDAQNFVHWKAQTSFLDDLNAERSYNPWVQYGNTKAANLLFTYQLNEIFEAKKVNVSSIAIHPGYTATNLQAGRFPFWDKANKYVAQTVREGSLSQIMAAVDPTIKPSVGTILGPEWRIWGFPVNSKTDKLHKERMKTLWEVSEGKTKTKFTI